ncbi:MAG: erythromycin esterase family protein, partial [Acidobacteriota bacterium]|nr:erythromycin esterase family protein [Acidobacteriota bacterium]
MYKRSFSTAFLVSVALFGLAGPASPPALADGNEIAPGIFRLNGIEETLPTGDLKPLKKLVRRVEVVGLGEDVHTTRGFSRAKFRLFKYLVRKRGFRVFGFESPWVEAERVATYVESCEGFAVNAIGGLFGVWQNESVRDLVEWMCEYNQDHPEDPVYFYGFDHQQAWDDAPRLKSYLIQFGVGESNKKVKRLDSCEGATSGSVSRYFATRRTPIPPEQHERCLDALNRTWKFLERRSRKLVKKKLAMAEDIEWARIHVVGLRAWQLQSFYGDTDLNRSYEERDRGMAYIAQKIRELRFPEAKTALWAHNGHISMGGDYIPGVDTMGTFLKRDLGDAYEPIGLVSYQANIDWPGVGCGPLDPSLPSSVEGRLREFGEEFLFVDLDFPGADEPLLDPGALFYLNRGRMVPRAEFRALVY